MGLAGGAAGLGVLGGVTGGILQFAASRANAKALKKVAAIRLEEQRRRGDVQVGRIRALYAKAGVQIESGSPIEVTAQAAAEAELAALRAEYEVLLMADQQKAAGTAALIGGILGGASQGLSAASQLGTPLSTTGGSSLLLGRSSN